MTLSNFTIQRSGFTKILFFLLFEYVYNYGIAQALSPDSLYFLAEKSLKENNYPAALKAYQDFLIAAQKEKNGLNIGNAYNGIGKANDKSGNYEDALSNYFKALKAYEAVTNERKQAATLKNIGNLYRVLKSYDKAENFFEAALKKYTKSDDSAGTSNLLNDIGILYMAQDSSQQAINFFKKVIYTYQKYTKDIVKGFALINLGIVYSNMGNYTEALKYYNLSIPILQKIQDQYGIASVLNNFGSIYNRIGNYKKGIKFSMQAMVISKKMGSEDLLADVYENLSDSYQHLNNYDSAYNYAKKEMVLKDTMFAEEKAKSYVEMETKYQNEKKQKEILQLQQENTLKNVALVNQRRTKYLLITILVFVSVVVVLLYKNYVIKQQLNKELNVLNTQLNEANESKTKLLSIISHDLRSPLSSLLSFLQLKKRNSARFTKEKEEEYNVQITASAENLLEAMEDLLIWSKSQMDSFKPIKEAINISSLLDEIIHLNSAAASNKDITILKECPQSVTLDTDPNFLKVILRNLTSNAIKFTPASGMIHLIAYKETNILNIAVKDNGPGIPANHLQTIFEWNSIRSDSSGLGLKLAKEFTTKLQGSISVISEQQGGTEFILSFPCN